MHELEDVLPECQRVINSTHATQLRAMAEIAARDGGEFKSEQVGLLLKWSTNWAADRVHLAEKVVDRLPASLAAPERGEIDLCKVQTVHDLTMNLSPEHARQVEDRVLERAAEVKAQRCVLGVRGRRGGCGV
jgi:hypothetical protein